MPNDGFAPSLAAALDAAVTESGVAIPDGDATDLPSVSEDGDFYFQHADDTTGVEQPTKGGDEIASLLEATVEKTEGAENMVDLNSDEFWEVMVDVETSDGPKTESIDGLRKGYMRQADYTKKTQELARERELTAEAVALHKAMLEDPKGFARMIAAKAGLIEDGEAPVKDVKLWTDADVDAEVTKRVDAKLAEHPMVKKAQEQEAVAAVTKAFDALEQKYNTKLSNEHRMLVLEEAQKRGVTDLDFVFQALLYQGSQKIAQRKGMQKAGTQRTTMGTSTEAPPKPVGKLTPAQAMDLALQELGALSA